MCQECRLLWKSPIWLLLALLDVPNSFLEVFMVNDWFHRVPWYVQSQENLKLLPLLWKKFIKTAVSFENYPFSNFGPFWRSWRLLWSFHCLQLGPSATQTCEKSRTTLVSPITLKKVRQDCCLLWKSPIWLFWALLDVPDGSLEVFMVSDWFHKVPWYVRIPEHCKSLP